MSSTLSQTLANGIMSGEVLVLTTPAGNGTRSELPRDLTEEDVLTNYTMHMAMGVILVIVGILGATGNGLVLYLFTRYRRLRSGGGPLILSLAGGDFVVSLLHVMPAYSSFRETWAFGELGCELYGGAVGLGGLGSLLTLSVIAADRFSVIFGKPVSWLSRKKTCACIWSLAFVLIVPPYLGWSSYCLEGLGTSCSWDYTTRTLSNRLYYIFLLTFGFLLPVTVIGISYYGILRVVYSHSSAVTGVSRHGDVSKQGPTKTDLKTAKVILLIIVCFLISWTPYALVSFIGQFGDRSWLTPMHTALPAIFAKASVIYNPFIYGLSHPHFRSAIRTMWFRSSSSRSRYNYPNGTPTAINQLAYNQNATSTYQLQAPFQQHMFNNMQGRRTSRPFPQVIGGQRRVLRHGNSRQPVCTSTDQTHFRTEVSQHDTLVGSQVQNVQRKRSSAGAVKILVPPQPVHDPGSLITDTLTNYSEPDLHRCGEGIEKNSKFLPQCEYRRKKRSFLRKALFRSENCLEQLLRSDSPKVAVTERNVSLSPNNKSHCHHHYPSACEPYLPSRKARRMSHGESSPRTQARKPCACGRRSSDAVPEKLSPFPIQIPIHLPITLQGAGSSSTNSSKSDCREEAEPHNGTPERKRSSSSSRRSSSSTRRKSSNIHLSSDNVVGRGPKTIVSFVPEPISNSSSRQEESPNLRKASGNSEFGQYYESCRSSQSHAGSKKSYESCRSSQSRCGSKKSSYESCMSTAYMGLDKHQLKYSLIHRRGCCECSFKHSGDEDVM